MKEHEEILNTKFDKNIDDLKSVAYISINTTFFPPKSHNYHSSSHQPSDDITKWPLLKSPDFHSQASQFTKHLSQMTLEGYNLLHIQKWRGATRSDLFQYLSTNRIWPTYKNVVSEHFDINQFLLPPDD